MKFTLIPLSARKSRFAGKLWFAVAGVCLLALGSAPAFAQYRVTNLVSSSTSAAPAQTIDPEIVNPWGLAAFPTGPFWVDAQNSSTSRLYTGSGEIVSALPAVQIPCVTDTGGDTAVPCPLPGEGEQFIPGDGQFYPFGPSGVVANTFASSGSFSISNGGASGPALFIFDTLDGLIVGWNPSVNETQGIVAVN